MGYRKPPVEQVTSLPKRNTQGATRGVARRDKTFKRWYTAIEAIAEMAWPPVNGAINGEKKEFNGRRDTKAQTQAVDMGDFNQTLVDTGEE